MAMKTKEIGLICVEEVIDGIEPKVIPPLPIIQAKTRERVSLELQGIQKHVCVLKAFLRYYLHFYRTNSFQLLRILPKRNLNLISVFKFLQ